MHILQISSTVGNSGVSVGGARRTLMAMREELHGHGHTITSLGLGAEASKAWNRIDRGDVAIVSGAPVPLRGSSAYQKALWHIADLTPKVGTFSQLLALCRRLKPDILLVHIARGWGSSPWHVARVLRIPLIQVMHDYSIFCSSGDLYRGDKECAGTCIPCAPRRLAARQLPSSTTLVGVSNAVLQRAASHAHLGRMPAHVIYPGSYISSDSTDSEQFDERPYRFGFIGKIEKQKGLDILLAAARTLGETVAVAGGTGNPLELELRQKFPGVGNWLGWQDSRDFLRKVQVLVVPSVWAEPFGRVASEAAAQGCRLVVSRRGGLPEAAALSGAQYQLTEPTVPALAEAMKVASVGTRPLRHGPGAGGSLTSTTISGLINEIAASAAPRRQERE